MKPHMSELVHRKSKEMDRPEWMPTSKDILRLHPWMEDNRCFQCTGVTISFIAKAIAEWLNEPCREHNPNSTGGDFVFKAVGYYFCHRYVCGKCMSIFQEEVKGL